MHYFIIALSILCAIGPNNIACKDTTKLTIGFMGDIMIGRGVNELLKTKPCSYAWGNLASILHSTDFNIANLETTLTMHDQKTPKVFNFKSDPKNADCLTLANITVVNLANNHSLDYGIPGLQETLQILQKKSIATVGAGNTISQAQKPVIITHHNIAVGILGFTDNEPTWLATDTKPGTQYTDLKNISSIVQQIKQLHSQVDIVIVSAHWGGNWPDEPTPEMRNAAHLLIDAGATIIHGHSAHITLGIERYKNGLIMYSTGDFINDYALDPIRHNNWSLFYQVTITKTGIKSARFIPVILTYGQTNRAPAQRATQILDQLIAQSLALKTNIIKTRNQGQLSF